MNERQALQQADHWRERAMRAEAEVRELHQALAEVYQWLYTRERQVPLPPELGNRVRAAIDTTEPT